MSTRALLAAVAATASLAACGAENPQPARTDDAEARKAMLDFARCMRQNGVDMPDPQFEGGGRVLQRGPRNVDPSKVRKAEQACAKYRDAVEPPELSEEDSERLRKAALVHSRCMREHGIEDFPDPQFDEHGGAQIRIGPGGVNPDDPDFRRAQEACRDTLPQPEDEQ